ncbi:hypothetical protein [Streptomyces sp. NRRL F-5755]|uniref:hypothetical protein n=1 Tax=Streptomyces sp. NRRL F-5755 TaxID=1519475 RepID=UPI000A404DD0|nr:hypothetical protein [Streptomyces sp. NRRL F-5755]
MSALVPRHRTILRTAAACAAVTAAVLGPVSGAFAAAPAKSAAASAYTQVRGEADGGGTYVRTVKVADGSSVVKIYRMGPGHYRADGFFDDGQSFGSIEATPAEPYDAGNLNGMIITLSSKGEVASWFAKARPTGPHNETLADGKTVVQVTELGDQHYRAVLVDKDGRTLGTMEVDGEAKFRAATKVGSLWAVLETDGGVTSYVAR